MLLFIFAIKIISLFRVRVGRLDVTPACGIFTFFYAKIYFLAFSNAKEMPQKCQRVLRGEKKRRKKMPIKTLDLMYPNSNVDSLSRFIVTIDLDSSLLSVRRLAVPKLRSCFLCAILLSIEIWKIIFWFLRKFLWSLIFL